MGGVGAEPWGRVPGPAVCGRRAGDSCPERRLRSRSRGRGQRLSDGPRRRPPLLTGEGADLGLGDPGRVGVAESGGLGAGGWDHTEGPSALLPVGWRGLGLCKVLVVRDPLPGHGQRLGRGRVGPGRIGLGSAGRRRF